MMSALNASIVTCAAMARVCCSLQVATLHATTFLFSTEFCIGFLEIVIFEVGEATHHPNSIPMDTMARKIEKMPNIIQKRTQNRSTPSSPIVQRCHDDLGRTRKHSKLDAPDEAQALGMGRRLPT